MSRPVSAFVIREFVDRRGHSPFRSWLATLDGRIQARIQARIFRFETGNLGDAKNLGQGIWEARLNFGSGYRVYFAIIDGTVILLLAGGDKASQIRDIRRARENLTEYLEAN
jgi:putative addiction module killer protein